MDLHHEDSQEHTVLPPDPPPDSDEDSGEDYDDGSLDVPDTVDPPEQDVHPLLKPRRRPYDIDVSRLPSHPHDGS